MVGFAKVDKGLVVKDKIKRVANFHKETVESVAEMLGSMGFTHTSELRPWHIMRRISSTETKHYGELYAYLKPGELCGVDIHPQSDNRYVNLSLLHGHCHDIVHGVRC